MYTFYKTTDVAVQSIKFTEYPQLAPFDPDESYPELGLKDYISERENNVYREVRLALFNLGLDKSNFGTKEWSPFREIIKPNDKVVIKPNLVMNAPNQDSVTTHGSVIRPVIDFVWKALDGKGNIYICDAPMAPADFKEITQRNGIAETVRILNLRGIHVFLEDLRTLKVVQKNQVYIKEIYDEQKEGQSLIVDLKENSFFNDKNFNIKNIYGGNYERHDTLRYHSNSTHKYCVSKRILEADVVISMPKLKTHKKAGVTCCLKNLVGINADKNYLPHFSVGPANTGGDEYPYLSPWRVPIVRLYRILFGIILGRFWRTTGRLVAFLVGFLNIITPNTKKGTEAVTLGPAYKFFYLLTGKLGYGGSWQGNETIWRMILDLNRIFLYADKDGELKDIPQRKTFYIVDGFIAGSKNGPLKPDVIKPGVVLAGYNSCMVDKVALLLAHIDPLSIPLYREALSKKCEWLHFNENLNIIYNGKRLGEKLPPKIMDLEPPDNWKYKTLTIM